MSHIFMKRLFSVPSDQKSGFYSFLALIMFGLLTVIIPLFITISLIVAICLCAFALLLATWIIVVYLRQFIYKELTFVITDILPLITINQDIFKASLQDNIEILFKSQNASNIRAMSLKIRSSGNANISEIDFHANPIDIKFSDNLKLLSAVLQDKGGQSIATPACNQHSIPIDAFFLTRKAHLDLRVLLELQGQMPDEVIKDITIQNANFTIVKEYDVLENRIKRRNIWFAIALLILSLFSLAMWTYVWLFSSELQWLSLLAQLFLTFVITISYVGLLVWMVVTSVTPKPSL